jgi:hypothetical protein
MLVEIDMLRHTNDRLDRWEESIAAYERGEGELQPGIEPELLSVYKTNWKKNLLDSPWDEFLARYHKLEDKYKSLKDAASNTSWKDANAALNTSRKDALSTSSKDANSALSKSSKHALVALAGDNLSKSRTIWRLVTFENGVVEGVQVIYIIVAFILGAVCKIVLLRASSS